MSLCNLAGYCIFTQELTVCSGSGKVLPRAPQQNIPAQRGCKVLSPLILS